MFPSLRSPRNIMSKNVSATMCPRLPGPYGMMQAGNQSRKAFFLTNSRPFISREYSDVNTACGKSTAGGEVLISFVAGGFKPNALCSTNYTKLSVYQHLRISFVEYSFHFHSSIIEFMFLGIKMFWALLRLILARASRFGQK